MCQLCRSRSLQVSQTGSGVCGTQFAYPALVDERNGGTREGPSLKTGRQSRLWTTVSHAADAGKTNRW